MITVATADDATLRLVIPAPWWLLIVGSAVAALVPEWRRRPLLAAPALLTTLPWWPVPLPPIALMWTGPLAWVPIGCALAAALGNRFATVIGRAITEVDCRRAMTLSGVLTLAAGSAVAWTVAPRVPSGDEPHYLVITQSLLKDHDLRIENNYLNRDYTAYFDGDLAPHYLARGRDGEIYSVHAPGLPVLVLPAFAVSGYRGVEVLLLLIAAVTGSLVWRIGWRSTGETSAAWFGWASIVGSATFLLHSFAVFPDGPAALAIAAAILLLLRLRQTPAQVGPRAITLVSILLAGLPWLHTRLVVLAIGLGLSVAWLLVTDSSRRPGPRCARAAWFLLAPFLSAVGWFAFFQLVYGTPNPEAPYGGGAGTRVAYMPGGLLGLLFDQQFGLIVYAPVCAMAAAGLVRVADATARRTAIATCGLAAVYLAAVATYWIWWAGSPANPTRFALAILPALAIPLSTAWSASDAPRQRALLTLLGVTLVISTVVIGVNRGELAWNGRDAVALWLKWLGPLVNLPRGWPSFFWKLDTAALTSEFSFAAHAVLWIGTFVAAWFVIRRLARDRTWDGATWRLAVGLWLLGATTVATQVGWWLNQADELAPARSQLAVLSADRRAIRLSAWTVSRVSSLAGQLIVSTEDPGRTDAPPPWLVLSAVPPGTYALHISTSRPSQGTLFVTVGRASKPVETFDLGGLSQRTFSLDLPAGAARLVIEPGSDVAPASSRTAIVGRIDIEPVRLLPGTSPPSTLGMRYASSEVFFEDDGAYVEDTGFWVRGGQSAELVVKSTAGVLSVALQNGARSNPVAVDAGGRQLIETLRPREERTIALPVAGPGGVIRLKITSPSGFRPSDTGASIDRRYLGVWVTVR